MSDTILAADESTWTFCGHWDNDELVIEFVLPGNQQDTRPDTGYWDQGLWAAAGTATTQDAAMSLLVEEYEADGWRWAGEDDQTPDD